LITVDNYKTKITDLIGLRALHLFKDEWLELHNRISAEWGTAEKPTANYRKGDHPDLLDAYRNSGCQLQENERGYRSVHYLIHTQPGKQKVTAELQVRTLYEEAWSEIDHLYLYPYGQKDGMVAANLNVLNRISSNADEMASLVKYSSCELVKEEERAACDSQTIKELMRIVAQPSVPSKVKSDLTSVLDSYKDSVDRVLSSLPQMPIRAGATDSILREVLPLSGLAKRYSSPTADSSNSALSSLAPVAASIDSGLHGASLFPKCPECGQILRPADGSHFCAIVDSTSGDKPSS
jgi:ppGpp synthetase/RelA/SpoT-type nucleotidyltranferase